MITREQAVDTVLALLHARGVGGADGVVIFEAKTLVKPYGWVLFYNARSFLEGGNIFDTLVGGGPVVVVSETGVIHELGSSRPALEEIAELEKRLGLLSS